MKLVMVLYIIAAAIGTLATPARSEPPFAGSEARGQCPKGFIKKHGQCWRRITDDRSVFLTEEDEHELEAEIGRRLEDLDRGRKAKQ